MTMLLKPRNALGNITDHVVVIKIIPIGVGIILRIFICIVSIS
jgi:amino acid transporter